MRFFANFIRNIVSHDAVHNADGDSEDFGIAWHVPRNLQDSPRERNKFLSK